MPAPNAHERMHKNMLADLRFLSALVIITALCTTLTILDRLNQHAEQRKREFNSIIIMIVCATLAIAGCVITSQNPPQACQNQHKQAQPAPI